MLLGFHAESYQYCQCLAVPAFPRPVVFGVKYLCPAVVREKVFYCVCTSSESSEVLSTASSASLQ